MRERYASKIRTAMGYFESLFDVSLQFKHLPLYLEWAPQNVFTEGRRKPGDTTVEKEAEGSTKVKICMKHTFWRVFCDTSRPYFNSPSSVTSWNHSTRGLKKLNSGDFVFSSPASSNLHHLPGLFCSCDGFSCWFVQMN